jgi:RNA polymerase sigma-70 factor (sigma-E family)
MRSDSEAEYVDYVSARLTTLHRTAFLLCGGDAHRADDIVQVTITRLYQRWKQASRADNLDAYVHRMLVHTFIDEKRRSWSRVFLLNRVDETVVGTIEADTAVEQRDELVTALRRLPPKQRAVLVLRFLCDRSIEEVAEILGCSQGTVKSHASRALAVLREQLATRPTTMGLI